MQGSRIRQSPGHETDLPDFGGTLPGARLENTQKVTYKKETKHWK